MSREKEATDRSVVRAYRDAVAKMRKDPELSAVMLDAGFILPPRSHIGRGVPRAGLQVFVKVRRFDEPLLKEQPETGGLVCEKKQEPSLVRNMSSHGPGSDKLHEWWGLSYASYLTIPRTILQSLPDAVQGRLADLLHEIDVIVSGHGAAWPPAGCEPHVELRKGGRFVKDVLSDYERGRRRLWPDQDAETQPPQGTEKERSL
jgi:hypothetical protein